MSGSPLDAIARWRASEGAVESGVPLAVVGGIWYALSGVLSAPAPGRPFSTLELAIVLGGASALAAWAVVRQAFLMSRRSPWTAFALGAFTAVAAMATVRPIARSGFDGWCADQTGTMLEIRSFDDAISPVCSIGALPGNTYLPGTLVHPAWSGAAPVWLWAWVGLAGALGGLGLRDRRLRSTRVVERFARGYRLASAAGPEAIVGDPPKEGRVVACANPTIWGEVCGQVYSADRVFQPGEWCVRCQQVFRPAERLLSFTVVTLFTGDIDVLNGLERLDTVAWPRGEPMPPDARISGQERWVELGSVRLPDVLTVGTALALVHGQLDALGERAGPSAALAIALAKARASRICCWIWQGRHANRLTYARPTPRAVFAVGPMRLRDLALDGGDELVLQLDIGLLPVELRTGFLKTFLDERRAAEVQNSKVDLWIPVAPPPETAAGGLWVDRVEGEALRAWLGTERRRDPNLRGVSVPLPYAPQGAQDVPAEPGAPLDLVRMDWRPDAAEPDGRRAPGDSIAEWDWLEWEQIQLLRQQCLVQVEDRR